MPSARPISEAAIDALTDTQTLLQRAVRLLAHDGHAMTRTARDAAGWFALTWAALVIGGILLSFGLVHALDALLPALPLGAWFAAVGVMMLGTGGLLLRKSRSKLDAIEPMQGDAKAALTEAGQVAARLDGVLESTKDMVRSSAASVHAAVDSVKQATDLPYQVGQRPWAMLAGAAALGYVGGTLLNATTTGSTPSPSSGGNGTGGAPGNGAVPVPQESHGFMGKLGEALAPQAGLAREIALGVLFGMARDWAREGVSKPFEQPLDDFFNDTAKRFGGRPSAPGQYRSPASNGTKSGAPPAL